MVATLAAVSSSGAKIEANEASSIHAEKSIFAERKRKLCEARKRRKLSQKQALHLLKIVCAISAARLELVPYFYA